MTMVDIHLRTRLWVYCPGHDESKGNDRADALGGKATITSGLRIRSELLRRLRHYLRAQSQGHHTIDRLEARGMERGRARRSSLKRREGHRQSNEHSNRFKGYIRETSERRGGEHKIVCFSVRMDTILSWRKVRSVRYGTYALGQACMGCILTLTTFVTVAFETVPFQEDCWELSVCISSGARVCPNVLSQHTHTPCIRTHVDLPSCSL